MAEAKGDVRTALTAVRELTRIIELKARLAERNTQLAERARKVVRIFAMAVRRHVKDPRVLMAIRGEMERYRETGIEVGDTLAAAPNMSSRRRDLPLKARESTLDG
jgi:hypothetical protein